MLGKIGSTVDMIGRRKGEGWFGERREGDALLQGGPLPSNPRHILALDGLRGAAILMVLAFHYYAGRPATSPFSRVVEGICQSGWIGVDLFFVLSGFLITGVLLRAKQSPNYFRTFYTRRALRLFPVYYSALILLFCVLIPISHHHAFGIGTWISRFHLESTRN